MLLTSRPHSFQFQTIKSPGFAHLMPKDISVGHFGATLTTTIINFIVFLLEVTH